MNIAFQRSPEPLRHQTVIKIKNGKKKGDESQVKTCGIQRHSLNVHTERKLIDSCTTCTSYLSDKYPPFKAVRQTMYDE